MERWAQIHRLALPIKYDCSRVVSMKLSMGDQVVLRCILPAQIHLPKARLHP